ncbi:LamG-like jellyroll fold domain-containing protein [Pedosphaera parvula]
MRQTVLFIQSGDRGGRSSEQWIGANNRAFNFNGATGFIDLGTADGLNLIGPMTATVWVKGNPADGRFQTIVGKGDTSWRVSMDADGFAHFAVGANKDAAGVHNINDGQWHFLAGVYDGTTQAIYVDGTLDGSQPTPSAFFGSAASVTIGGVPDHATDRLFAGSIDEVAIFDSALSLSQIQQIFYSGNIAPLISQQPQLPGSVFEGSALTITVGAVGTPTLNYQWTKNGASITGKTTSSLAFSSIAASDSGSYAVVITNNYGAITSSIVALAVQSSPPYILQQPQAFSRYQGGFGTLSVTAAGTAPLAYQWYFNGTTKIAGATASSYPLSNLQFANAGNYSCTITNTHGATNTVTVALTVVGAPAGAYAATILADNPLAYWRLGETNGTVAHDYLGNHDGQYTNATLGVPGYSAIDTNAAMSIGPQFNSFVGNIQGIDFGTGTNAAFSVEAWVKGPVVQNGDVGFITKGTGAGGEQFNLDNGNGGKYRFFVRGTQNVIQSCNSSIALDGTWQHLVGVCDGPGGSLHLFVNGVEVATTTAPGDILPSTHAVSIGSRQSGSSATGPYDFNFTGSMDEVAIYGTALSATQVQAHYAARYGSSTPAAVGVQPVATTNYVTLQGVFTVYGGGTDPVSYQWKFNGVDIADATSDTLVVSPLDLTNAGNYSVTVSNPFGTTNSSAAHLTVLPAPTVVDVTSGLLMHLKFDGDYRDYSGRGNNGTNVGATTFVPGKIGANALHYFTDSSSASYSYVTLGLRPDLQFSSNVNFSVAFWVRQPAGALQGDLPFLCNALGSTYSPGYVIAPSYKSGGWGWSLYDKTGSTGMGANGGDGTINDGNWHHVVHTFDRNGYGLTYVDGIRVDGRPIVGAGDLNTGQPTNIGQDPTGTYAETGEADIDDFGVWQRVLSPMEISAMYVGGSINGVSFASAPVKMTLQPLGNQLQIVWPAGLLQAADQVTGPYTDVTAATSPYTVTPAAAKKFYRVKL